MGLNICCRSEGNNLLTDSSSSYSFCMMNGVEQLCSTWPKCLFSPWVWDLSVIIYLSLGQKNGEWCWIVARWGQFWFHHHCTCPVLSLLHFIQLFSSIKIHSSLIWVTLTVKPFIWHIETISDSTQDYIIINIVQLFPKIKLAILSQNQIPLWYTSAFPIFSHYPASSTKQK